MNSDYKEKADELKLRFIERLKNRKPKIRVIPNPPPKYDKIFFEGVKYLDKL